MTAALALCLLLGAGVAPDGGPSLSSDAPREEEAAALGAAVLASAPSDDDRAREMLGAKRFNLEAAQLLLRLPNLTPNILTERRAALSLEKDRRAQIHDAGPRTATSENVDPRIALALLDRVEATAAELIKSERLEGLVAEQDAARDRAAQDADRADQARREALDDAKTAATGAEQEILEGIAASEGQREDLARATEDLFQTASSDIKRLKGERDRADGWLQAAEDIDHREPSWDELLVTVLDAEDVALTGVMDALHARAEAAKSAGPEMVNDTADRGRKLALRAESVDAKDDLVRLFASLDALAKVRKDFARERKERWLDVATAHFEVAQRLHAARLAIINRLSSNNRAELDSFSSLGLRNVRVVTRYVWTRLRLLHQNRVHEITHLPETLSDPLVLGPAAWSIGTSLFALFLLIWVWRQASTIRKVAHDAFARRVQSPTSARAVAVTFYVLDALVGPALVVAMAAWLNAHLRRVLPDPERTLLVEVAIWWAVYQALTGLTHLVIVRYARGRFAMPARRKLKLLRSIRFVLRYVFVATYIARQLSEMVGPGPVIGGIRALSIAGGVVVLVIIVRRWRDDLHEHEVALKTPSFLQRPLAAVRGRWFALPVETVASTYLAIRALLFFLRDFAMGFDQIRRAGAFLFRLRVEREAQRKGRAKFDEASIPDVVRNLFSMDEVFDPELLVDRTAEIEIAVNAVCSKGDERLSVVVHAPYGVGRATWLTQLKTKLEIREQRVVVYRPSGRVLGAGKLAARLSQALDAHPDMDPPDEVSTDAIVDTLNAAEGPLVVIVDGLEWLFLRTVNGYRAIDSLVDIMHRTHKRVSFVLSAPTAAYQHLDRVRSLSTEVSRVLQIPPFTEKQIYELIRRRQRKSGVRVSFAELLVQDMDGLSDAAHVVENEEGYMRLLWTFSEGNPRVALHFWLRSLVPDPDVDGALLVQLYEAPNADDLEAIPEKDRFFLQSIVLHRALTVDEVAATCDVRRSQVQAHIHRGLEMGLYTEFGATAAAARSASSATDSYTVDIHYWEAVVRFLRRKKLLAS